jgi:phosphate transport system substrate-binding protein
MMRTFVGMAVALTVMALVLAISIPVFAAASLNGAGATFPEPIYAVWMYKYNQLTGVRVDYQGIGSSGGIRQIKARTVDFGGSDAPMKGPELREAGLIQFPMVIGGVVPIYNVQGIEAGQLKLTPEVLAGVFSGEINYWDDEAITSLNPGFALPNEPITVVHRAEGSGTTWMFTNYLDKVSSSWHEKIGTGKIVSWPVGVGAKGNPGVANYVQRVNGSIGYVEYAYAVQNNLPHVSLKNRAGMYVQPGPASFQAAAGGADWANADGYYLVLTDQPGDDSWPIVGATFILIYADQDDAGKAEEMLKFFDWCYEHGGEMAIEKDYVPIPKSVADMVRQTWADDVRAGGAVVWE